MEIFEISNRFNVLFASSNRDEALRATRHFRRIERKLGRNLPIVMDRVS